VRSQGLCGTVTSGLLSVASVVVLLMVRLTAQVSAPAPLPSVTLPAPLARVLTDYETAWRAKDAAALAALFADDRVVVPNACPPVRGRAGVQACYTGSGGPLFLRAVAYNADSASGYIIGAYRSEEAGPDAGKFTLTLTKGADGRWLIVADMDAPYRRR
jgi:ketosteroid isomerase-like protein